MSIQSPYFIQREHFTETHVALANEALQCNQSPAFLFTTPDYVLRGENKLAEVQGRPQSTLADWLGRARQQLQDCIAQGHTTAKIMGGIPFVSAPDLHLMVMESSRFYQKILYAQPDCTFTGNTLKQSVFLPSAQQYQQQVAELVQQLRAGQLDKAVLARILQLEFSHDIDLSGLFYNLARHNPEGYSYAVGRDPAAEGWFMGASPELLVAKQGQQIWSKPVAGTLARSEDPVLDQQYARQLLTSAKDQHEHALVIEMIADELSPFCRRLSVPKQPALIRTKRLWHLATRIDGELKSADTHVFDLVERLHPTPAICGQPTATARDLIEQIEPFNRELFAGTMGWADAQGNGEWSVTVRCARIYRNIARLFAGAGIVAASDPDAERAETAAKFRTILDGFGLSPEQLSQRQGT